MRKKSARVLALLMILVLAAMPKASLAQGEGRPEAFLLTVDAFRLVLPGAEPMDISLALTLAAGLNQAGDRGLWVMDLSSPKSQVLNLATALESGNVKTYLRNSIGGLQYLLQSPAKKLTGMAEQFTQSAGIIQMEGMEELAPLLNHLTAFAESMKDPAYQAEFGNKLLSAFETAFQLKPAGEEEIQLFHVNHTAQKFTGETDFAGLWSALPDILGADPALLNSYGEFAHKLEEGGVLGQGMAFADVPRLLKEEGGDFKVDVTEYKAGEVLRVEVLMTGLQEGKQIGTIRLTIDSDTAPGHPALSIYLKTDIPNANNLEVMLESASVVSPGSKETDLYFGVSFKQSIGSADFALQLDARQTDATPQSRAAYHMFLSMGAWLEPTPKEGPANPTYFASIGYDGENYELDGMPISAGQLSLEFAQGDEDAVQLSFNTLLKLATLAEGELLSTDGSLAVLDITNMTEEQNAALTEDIGVLINNSAALLFQDPGLAALLGAGTP